MIGWQNLPANYQNILDDIRSKIINIDLFLKFFKKHYFTVIAFATTKVEIITSCMYTLLMACQTSFFSDRAEIKAGTPNRYIYFFQSFSK